MFDPAVARRLRELRAVCDLVHHLSSVAARAPDRGERALEQWRR